MLNRRLILKTGLAAFCIALAPLTMAGSADAYDGCTGIVYGLSQNYNLARGTGFLAVRTRPTTRSRMIDQLFNGERVQIFSRRGNWYEITYSRGNGWAYARYIDNECNY